MSSFSLVYFFIFMLSLVLLYIFLFFSPYFEVKSWDSGNFQMSLPNFCLYFF